VRPNTYEQGRMLAEKAGTMKYAKWATIGPNYEYGKRAWETFPRAPQAAQAGRPGRRRALGRRSASSRPGPFVTAILNQNPDALYVSLFGSDWLAFVREAQKRGLFQTRCSWWASCSASRSTSIRSSRWRPKACW
jgi:branched-chain amino acid transport system substrate-binding protein